MKKLLNIILGIAILLGATNHILKTQINHERLPAIGVLIYDYNDDFVYYMRTAMEEAAKGRAELLINDSANDQTKQLDQIDAMIERRVNALAVNLVDSKSAPYVASKAKKAGIPVVFFNKEYKEGTNKLPYNKLAYVGTCPKEAAYIQAELIVDAWNENMLDWDKNDDGKIQYVMLRGEEDNVFTGLTSDTVIKVIEKAGIETEEIESGSGEWRSARATKLMDNWLGKHGHTIEMVISNNDSMALGAIESLKAQGYYKNDKYMPVVGIDGTPEALNSIENKELLGTVLNDPRHQAEAIITMSLNAAQGKEFTEGTRFKLDKTKAVRIPVKKIEKE